MSSTRGRSTRCASPRCSIRSGVSAPIASGRLPRPSHCAPGDTKEITGAIADGSIRTRYLLEGPNAIDESVLAACRDKGITVVAALNTFGYTRRAAANPMEAARADAERRMRLGVRYFQINSVYDRFFLG